MAFKICRAISNGCISSRMGFVERIGRKGAHFIKNLVCDFFRNSVAHCAGKFQVSVFVKFSVNEIFPFLRHNVKFFLAHCTANKVCPSVGISRKLTDNFHNLFLIDDASVCNIENRFKKRSFVSNFFRVVAVFKIFRNGIHRAGAIKRNNRRKVFDGFRAKTHKNASHARRLELENALGSAFRKHFINFRVAVRNF